MPVAVKPSVIAERDRFVDELAHVLLGHSQADGVHRTGPKISSRAIRIVEVTSVKIVGSTYQPLG